MMLSGLKKVSKIHITGILSKGRQKLRMTDVVHKDLKDIGVKKELAEDRVALHAAIKPLTDANKCVQSKNMEEAL